MFMEERELILTSTAISAFPFCFDSFIFLKTIRFLKYYFSRLCCPHIQAFRRNFSGVCSFLRGRRSKGAGRGKLEAQSSERDG